MKYILSIISLLFIAQSGFSFALMDSTVRHEKFFISWGWNRSNYSNSNIKFKGDDNNFTLKKVVAKDRQSDFSINEYFNPTKATIPQYNFRVGYFIKENLSLSFGFDHMKYVVEQLQTTTISGEIKNSGTSYDGTYTDDEIQLEKDFLEFEHTDGLNYLNLELRRNDKLVGSNKISINLISGLGAGVLFPKTNTRLLSKERHDEFHVSGYGVAGAAGLNISFFEKLYIQGEYKGGFINMPYIRTSPNKSDSASQNFVFSQFNISLGGYILIKNDRSKRKKR